MPEKPDAATRPAQRASRIRRAPCTSPWALVTSAWNADVPAWPLRAAVVRGRLWPQRQRTKRSRPDSPVGGAIARTRHLAPEASRSLLLSPWQPRPRARVHCRLRWASARRLAACGAGRVRRHFPIPAPGCSLYLRVPACPRVHRAQDGRRRSRHSGRCCKERGTRRSACSSTAGERARVRLPVNGGDNPPAWWRAGAPVQVPACAALAGGAWCVACGAGTTQPAALLRTGGTGGACVCCRRSARDSGMALCVAWRTCRGLLLPCERPHAAGPLARRTWSAR